MGILIGQPFDTIKVRQQAFQNSSIIFQTKNLITNEGHRSFFRGMTFPLIFVGAQNSLFFGFYGIAKDLNGVQDMNKYLKAFTCGCLGGVGQLVVSCPVDLVKIKMQVQKDNKTYQGSFNVARRIYKHHGFRGLFHGFGIVSLRDVVSYGLYMSTYTWLTDKMSIQNETVNTFIAGGIAGWISWASILPFDVVKSKLQADCYYFPKYRGISHCAMDIFRNGGLKAFSRGFLTISVRSFPVNGFTFIGYEYTMKLCHRLKELNL
ncbi:solute carrier family 25 member 45 isoform X2 [Lepeophtheirus salmonis]|nr:solute carrier family 25 member 45-like isoform X2 [Lepeophtheirus salmonis]